jgi:hypothetical protein
MTNTSKAPARTGAELLVEESIQREHPMARYAKDDHGVMREGSATWPAAKKLRKATAVKIMSAAVALPNTCIFMQFAIAAG